MSTSDIILAIFVLILCFILGGIPLIITIKRYKRANENGAQIFLLGCIVPAVASVIMVPSTTFLNGLIGTNTVGMISAALIIVIIVFSIIGLVTSGKAYKKKMVLAGAEWNESTCPYCGAHEFKIKGSGDTPEWAKEIALGVGVSRNVVELAETARGEIRKAAKSDTYQCDKCKSKWIVARSTTHDEG
jgi:ribosomal protein L37AE/L43A